MDNRILITTIEKVLHRNA